MMIATVHATLFSKRELTAYNAFSMLYHEPSTSSHSSTGAHAKKVAATWHHMLYGGHGLPPSSGVSGSSTCWVSHQLCRFYPWFCSQCQLPYMSHCAHCSLNPWKVNCELRGWKKMRSHRNCRHIHSLLTDAIAVTIFSPGWCRSPSSRQAIFSPLMALSLTDTNTI